MKRTLFATLLSLCATSAIAAPDACMTGTWRADLNDVAAMMARQMGGAATPTGGTVLMVVAPDGSFSITTDGMQIAVTPPNVPTVEVSVTGYSRGSFGLERNTFRALVNDYRLVGSADVLGQRMDIPFDASTGAFGNASGTYTCDANTLQFAPTSGGMARLWTR